MFRNLGKDDETALKAMASRYEERTKMVEDFDEFPVDPNDALAIRQSLLPTAADPTMWCIRCQVRHFSENSPKMESRKKFESFQKTSLLTCAHYFRK